MTALRKPPLAGWAGAWVAMTLWSYSCALLAQEHDKMPAVVALVATVGDQVTFTRQRASVSSHIDPTYRKTVPIPNQALNASVLRGLDRAISKEEPDARRVLLLWNTPNDTKEALKKVYGSERNDMLLAALIEHLRAVPQRAEWDRVEAIVPRYVSGERDGMGNKLGGIGVYVQPLKNIVVEFGDNGEATTIEHDGQSRTVDPKTGEKGNYSTFIAPFFYFDRVTLDAKTLEVLRRTSHFDNTKYHDPNSTALDVADQMPVSDMLRRLANLMEQSAYRAVRGVRPEVLVSPLQEKRP